MACIEIKNATKKRDDDPDKLPIFQGADGAAELLQINASTLRHRMRTLGIPYGRQARKNLNL